MDPFSAEGELLTIHNAFHQGQYQVVLDFDPSSLSKSNVIPARVLKLRAQIASGDAKGAISTVKNESGPDFAAVKAFAQHTLGDMSTAIKQVEQLVESSSENATVQILGGIVLQLSGRTEEALSLLSKHQGNLEASVLLRHPLDSPTHLLTFVSPVELPSLPKFIYSRIGPTWL
ncbi:MAG: hypothetical protein LQ341_004039 [Variospora aurantia]|nr:MAG: hypothetical protein LQ341_004039 [Variospora aurantia]